MERLQVFITIHNPRNLPDTSPHHDSHKHYNTLSKPSHRTTNIILLCCPSTVEGSTPTQNDSIAA